MVGNTIKSKKMPEYIAKFLAIGIRLLLRGEGQKFLEEYYNYIEKIYNYKIPLRDIATKGKIKKSIKEYLKDVQTLTKAGRPKSRQAWYELAIKNNISVGNGETLYYVNTGKSKSHSDIKKITNYYILDMFGEEQIIDKEIDKLWKTEKENYTAKEEFINEHYQGTAKKKETIVFNSELVPRNIIDKEEDTFCSDIGEDFEYNVPKYIDMFNKRITPLLVCFSRSIRDRILIDNPDNRQYFTIEECELVSGEPNKPTDQDTYEQLMTMEDKEIKFWKKYNLVPPFVEECGMGKWEDILSDYDRRMEEEERNGISAEKEAYDELLSTLTEEEYQTFLDEGEIPNRFYKIVDIDPLSMNLVSKVHKNAIIGHISDFLKDKTELDKE